MATLSTRPPSVQHGAHPPPTTVALYIEPASHHFLRDRLFVIEDGRPNGDRINAPYAHLRARLEHLGIPVHTADHLIQRPIDPSVLNVYVSMGRLENYRALSSRPDTILSAYFAMECPIVEPQLFRALPDVARFFRHIYSWSDGPALAPFVGASLNTKHFYWPQSFDDVHQSIWQRTDREPLVMINSNKLPRLYWRELYTERLKAVEYFSGQNAIDLYGFGWDQPSSRVGRTWMPYTLRRAQRAIQSQWQRLRPDLLLVAARRVYRGLAASKAETLGNYTFALCFENMILKGWITEKIFDCFFAGTVPIYWGAPEITEVVPPECFIDMREFGADYAALHRFLKALGPRDIERYREAARAFLHSPAYTPFTKEAFTRHFLNLVEEVALQRGIALDQRATA